MAWRELFKLFFGKSKNKKVRDMERLVSSVRNVKDLEKGEPKDKIRDMLKKLVEYEFICLKHQPQLFYEYDKKEIKEYCLTCPLKTDSGFCKLGQLRYKLQKECLKGNVPDIFIGLVFGDFEKFLVFFCKQVEKENPLLASEIERMLGKETIRMIDWEKRISSRGLII